MVAIRGRLPAGRLSEGESLMAQPTSTPSSETALETFKRYIVQTPAAILRRLEGGDPIDYDRLGFWAFPVLQIGSAGLGSDLAIVDQTAFDARVIALYGGFHADGWREVRLEHADVTLVVEGLAAVDCRGVRLRGDGSVVNRFRATYWLRRYEARWLQVATLDMSAPIPDLPAWTAWLRSALTDGRGPAHGGSETS